ncbi:MAG: metal ABC transporter permease [Candidatus Bipolaricaulota bacterium]|nr:metal ABC transporter permease [Candidatus Bipolaricaulota bacterium]MDW8030505.1 metal ABC transporter permease [Candidatus Bipolaricaulota bacterium]
MGDIFAFGFMRLAFVGGTIVGVLAPIIGTFLVLRRYGLIGDGLGHVAFGGVAFGHLMRTDPILMALVYSTVAAVGMEQFRVKGRLGGDVAIAIFLSSGLALGLVLARLARRSTDQLWTYLFGSVIALQPGDVIQIALIAFIVLGSLWVMRRGLFFVTFDEETARASGVPVGFYNIALVLLAALTVVSAIQIVGLLLISALLVLPVAAALQVARSFRQTLVLGVGSGLLSVYGGLIGSYYLDTPPGPTIVLMALGIFLLANGARLMSRSARVLAA